MMNTAQGNFDEPVDTLVIGKNISEIVKKKIEKLPANIQNADQFVP